MKQLTTREIISTLNSNSIAINAIADLTIQAPEGPQPTTAEDIHKLGAAYWPLEAYRELDDALLHLRVNEPLIGLVCLRTEGDSETVLQLDQTLLANRDHWLVREILSHMARVLRRLDLTAKSFFAIVEPGSCFAGNLLELLLASDRSYMLKDSETGEASLAVSELNAGAFPMSNGLTRLQSRFLADPQQLDRILRRPEEFQYGRSGRPRTCNVRARRSRLGGRNSSRHRRTHIVIARRAHRHGSVTSFRWSGNDGHKNLRPPDSVAKLDLPAPERSRRERRVDKLRQANAGGV